MADNEVVGLTDEEVAQMTIPELKVELRGRRLWLSGRRRELVQLLAVVRLEQEHDPRDDEQENDDNNDEEEEDEEEEEEEELPAGVPEDARAGQVVKPQNNDENDEDSRRRRELTRKVQWG